DGMARSLRAGRVHAARAPQNAIGGRRGGSALGGIDQLPAHTGKDEMDRQRRAVAKKDLTTKDTKYTKRTQKRGGASLLGRGPATLLFPLLLLTAPIRVIRGWLSFVSFVPFVVRSFPCGQAG